MASSTVAQFEWGTATYFIPYYPWEQAKRTEAGKTLFWQGSCYILDVKQAKKAGRTKREFQSRVLQSLEQIRTDTQQNSRRGISLIHG